MPGAWMVADSVLLDLLRTYFASLPEGQTWVVDLYVNDHTPEPGDVLGDYVVPTWGQWPGYQSSLIPIAGWGEVQVVDHVAQAIQAVVVSWALPNVELPVTVYGYTISTGYGVLLWAEQWDYPYQVDPNQTISINPQFNLGIFPIPTMLNQKRGRKARFQEPDDLDEENE